MADSKEGRIVLDARTASGVWIKDAEVQLPGDEAATADRNTWQTVAVLEVTPVGTPFLIGWRSAAFPTAEFYSEAAEPDYWGRYGMLVGDQDVTFIARHVHGRTQLTMKLVKRTTRDDPEFDQLPLY